MWVLEYPFQILLVMLLARVAWFDSWTWPPSLIALYGINFSYAVGSGLAMRHAAEQARKHILRRLQARLAHADYKDQIVNVREAMAIIAAESRGAFAPFSENPILRAILIPSGGMSLVALLEVLGSGP